MIKLLVLITLSMTHSLGLWIAYANMTPDTHFKYYVIGFHAASFFMSIVWFIYILVIMHNPLVRARKSFYE